MVTQIKGRVSAEEFYALQSQTDERLELIDGEVIVANTPNIKHQDVVASVIGMLRAISKLIGGRAFVAPVEVYLDRTHIPQPDVMWIAPDGKCQITDKNLVGAPDLVVEVFSPGTERYDKREKFNMYQQFGVREYWMIHPDAEYVEVWGLQDGVFVRQGIYAPGDTFISAILRGQTITVSEFLVQ